MKTKCDVAGRLRGPLKTSVYLAAGAALLMTVGQAAPPSGQTTRGQTQPSEGPQTANHADKTTGYSTTASQPKTGLRAALGIRLSKDQQGGAILETVRQATPAARAGLRAGDQILAVNGVRVRSTEEFLSLLHKQDWRSDFRILIDRDGHARQLVVRGGTLNSPTSTGKQNDQAAIGIVMSEKSLARGVLVSKIYPGSPAAEAGLRPGDLVMAVDGTRVTSPEELRDLIVHHRPGDKLDLSINRDGWHRNFLLISMGQSDLAKLPPPHLYAAHSIAPSDATPSGATPSDATPSDATAPSPEREILESELGGLDPPPGSGAAQPSPNAATPGSAFGKVGGPAAQPLPTDSAPRDSWGNTYDVNRRALYTDFD